MSEPELDRDDPKNHIPRYCPAPPHFFTKKGTFKLIGARKAIWASIIMSRETSLSNEQKAFIQHAIQHNTRLDGRELDEYRDLTISFADYGHVTVQLGHTSVSVILSAEIAKPTSDSPFEGLFSINLELNEMASPAFQSGRSGDYEAKILEILDQVYRRSGALDTESLCIIAGKACWKINAHIHVTSYEGNMLDASSIALLAALQHFRLRDSEVRGGQAVIYDPKERDLVPLNITYKPLVVSYCCFANNKTLVLDPTRQEEQAAQGEFVIALDTAGLPSLIKTFSGPELDPAAALHHASDALQQVIGNIEVIEVQVQEDLAKRLQWQQNGEATSKNDRPVDAPSIV